MLGSLNLSMGRQGGSPEGSIVAELRFLVQQGSATGGLPVIIRGRGGGVV